jgi:hypothetical protein
MINSNAKCPAFWVQAGPSGLHQYKLRCIFDEVKSYSKHTVMHAATYMGHTAFIQSYSIFDEEYLKKSTI